MARPVRTGLLTPCCWKRRNYGIVLGDLRMPNLSGTELYAELRQRGLARTTQFVVPTGDIADADAQPFLDHSQVSVLPKPLELKALPERVEG